MSFLTPAALAALGMFGGVPSLGAYGAYRGARALTKSRGKTRNMKTRVPKPLSLRGVHTFRRAVEIPIDYTPSTGVNITGSGVVSPNMAISFGLQNHTITIGATAFQLAVPNYTQLTSLFDNWRIKNVVVRLMYSHTAAAETYQTGLSAPIIRYVWDHTDDTVVPVTEILQMPGFKSYQFANGASTTGFSTRGVPKALLGTGIELADGTTTGGRPMASSTWLETISPSIALNGLKICFVNNLGTTTVTQGRFSLMIDTTYELKDVK